MLKVCPECGRAVSEYAEMCPNCGLPVSLFEKAFASKITCTATEVDLGLPSGTIWASCNVGAKSAYDIGAYYAWGDCRVKEEYTWDNYKYYLGELKEGWQTYPRLAKYVCHRRLGIVDDKSYLELIDDPATQIMGSQWCTPSYDQQEELLKCCKIQKEDSKGVSGYRVIGPNGNSLFFVNSGYFVGDKMLRIESPVLWLNRANPYGYENATFFLIMRNIGYTIATMSPKRCCGLPIRPVLRQY